MFSVDDLLTYFLDCLRSSENVLCYRDTSDVPEHKIVINFSVDFTSRFQGLSAIERHEYIPITRDENENGDFFSVFFFFVLIQCDLLDRVMPFVRTTS